MLGAFADPIYLGDWPASVKQRISYLPQITSQLVLAPYQSLLLTDILTRRLPTGGRCLLLADGVKHPCQRREEGPRCSALEHACGLLKISVLICCRRLILTAQPTTLRSTTTPLRASVSGSLLMLCYEQLPHTLQWFQHQCAASSILLSLQSPGHTGIAYFPAPNPSGLSRQYFLWTSHS